MLTVYITDRKQRILVFNVVIVVQECAILMAQSTVAYTIRIKKQF